MIGTIQTMAPWLVALLSVLGFLALSFVLALLVAAVIDKGEEW